MRPLEGPQNRERQWILLTTVIASISTLKPLFKVCLCRPALEKMLQSVLIQGCKGHVLILERMHSRKCPLCFSRLFLLGESVNLSLISIFSGTLAKLVSKDSQPMPQSIWWRQELQPASCTGKFGSSQYKPQNLVSPYPSWGLSNSLKSRL